MRTCAQTLNATYAAYALAEEVAGRQPLDACNWVTQETAKAAKCCAESVGRLKVYKEELDSYRRPRKAATLESEGRSATVPEGARTNVPAHGGGSSSAR